MKNIVFYDGECGFCTLWVQWILKADKEGRICFAALQSEQAKNILRKYGAENSGTETILFLSDGVVYDRLRAVSKIGTVLGRHWNILRLLSLLPKNISDRVYNIVAKNRFRIAGKTCYVPNAKERERFITDNN